MASKAPDDPILKRFRAAVAEIYGDRAATRSGVFLRDLPDRFAELDRLADLSTNILDETGQFIHAVPYRADAYDERTPLMHEIHADGIDL